MAVIPIERIAVMAYLNQQERERLQEDLKNMSFNRARRRLRGIDPKGRLAFLRNVQNVNQWVTRYELSGLGTRVTLIEALEMNQRRDGSYRSDYDLLEVVVEPTADNRT
jgi:hypothetical protein